MWLCNVNDKAKILFVDEKKSPQLLLVLELIEMRLVGSKHESGNS